MSSIKILQVEEDLWFIHYLNNISYTRYPTHLHNRFQKSSFIHYSSIWEGTV